MIIVQMHASFPDLIFRISFLQLTLQQTFPAFKLISNNFLREICMSKINTKEETKTKSLKPKLLKTLNINQF